MQESEVSLLIHRIGLGDRDATAEVFVHYRPRLRRMVELRMNPDLQGRVDPSDVIQETFLDYTRRATEYARKQDMPFFLWLRMLTGQKLLQIHRRHFEVQARDVKREVSIHADSVPGISAVSLAGCLLADLTSASKAVHRDERKQQLQRALLTMDEVDREILALRHFEDMKNGEVATILGLTKFSASKRYFRALQRLKEILSEIPGFLTEE